MSKTLLTPHNVLVLAKAAKTFKLPVVLSAVETKGFSGNTR